MSTGAANYGISLREFSNIVVRIYGDFGPWGTGCYGGGAGGADWGGEATAVGLITLGGGVGGLSSFSEAEGVYWCSCSGYKIINIIA